MRRGEVVREVIEILEGEGRRGSVMLCGEHARKLHVTLSKAEHHYPRPPRNIRRRIRSAPAICLLPVDAVDEGNI